MLLGLFQLSDSSTLSQWMLTTLHLSCNSMPITQVAVYYISLYVVIATSWWSGELNIQSSKGVGVSSHNSTLHENTDVKSPDEQDREKDQQTWSWLSSAREPNSKATAGRLGS